MLEKRINPNTIGFAALIVLLGALNGAGTARAIWKAAGEYERRKTKERRRADSELGYDTMKVVLSRLEKSGLVEKTGTGLWQIVERAKVLVLAAQAREENTDRGKNTARDTIIIFDIPEKDRKKRAYLRFELIALGFGLLQKSVWIGPGPLPKEFIEYMRKLRLFSYVHIFSIKKKGTISSAIDAS